MKKLGLMLLCCVYVVLPLQANSGSAGDAAPTAVQEKANHETNAPALTIYNQNFFVARERLPMDLKPGVNHVEFAEVAAHVEPDSVILRDPGGCALQIFEQNYRNDPISQELLLSLYEGKTIDFVVLQNGEKIETVRGKIIRSGYVSSATYAPGYPQPASSQPIIEMNGVLRFGLPGQPLFPALTGDSILKPTLNWLLQTENPFIRQAVFREIKRQE